MKKFQEKQTNVVLAQAIFDVHHEFGRGKKGGGHHHGQRRQLCGCLQVLRCGEYACGGKRRQDPDGGFGQPANLHAQLEEVAPAVVKLPSTQMWLKDADFLMATAPSTPTTTISLVRHFSPDQAADIRTVSSGRF
ncbi:hypothetical protein GWK47_052223 [Chionoecetes opilio]|uniref:Uncharacterized protein n=1 Tax=Chionoecetes opilio TaxID=41210 RepID=A0A8J4Y1U0_CHIOP|nr:hypothetical protein GWK47_052223 [Chionoecetes opilio]